MASNLIEYIDFNKPSFWLAAAAIAFNPTFWNIAARQEYHNKWITKLFGGNPYYGCYFLAVTIFSLGIFRDTLYTLLSSLLIHCLGHRDNAPAYERALREQPTHPLLAQSPLTTPLSVALFTTGNILVLTSMYALGITGTYLGDYFGILMDEVVTGFPFNVTGSPMYWGSTMSFLGTALWYRSFAGMVLSAEVFVAYWIALGFEDPFTAEIYAKRETERKNGKKGQ